MTDTLYFNPHKSMAYLVDHGMSESDAIATLVRLKDTQYCVKFSGTSYFDPRELERLNK